MLSEEVAGQVQVAYQYSPWGQRLSQVKFKVGGVTEDSFYGYNPHSDVETLTNEAGDTRATYGYTAYGRNDTESFTGIDKPDAQNPTAEPYNVYRFNAKRFDAASGDYDMGFRDYDPGLNRFLSRDNYNGALADLDLGLSPWTMNRYGFAGGNPVSFIELDGHRLPDEDLRELREAGYTYVMGRGVVPLGASRGASDAGLLSGMTLAASKSSGGFGSTELHNAVRSELLHRLCPWKGSYFEALILGRCEEELKMPGSRDRADIVLFGRGEVYEVKPDTDYWIRQGKDQVDRYLAQLNKARVRMPEYRPGTTWLKGKDPGAQVTGIRAWQAGRAFRSFHMDYKGHSILVRYAEHGVATYRPECGECDEHENVEKPTTWYTVMTPFRWLSNFVLPGVRPAPVPVPA